MEQQDAYANAVIDRLGGTSAVARIFDIRPSSVHQWRIDGLPKARLQYLKVAFPKILKSIEEAAH